MTHIPVADTESEQLPQHAIAIARQAIVDANRAVFGYELFDRSQASDRHTAESDATMLFNVLSNTDAGVLIDRKTLFINCTHQTLAGGHLELIHPDRLVLEMPPLAAPEPEDIETHAQALSEITARGFRLAFDESVLSADYASWLPMASFVKIDLSCLTTASLATLCRRAQQNCKAQLVAEKVETSAQFEMAAGLGIKLFQGYWFARPVLITGQALRPAQANIIALINLIRRQASTNEIEDVIKRDPTLSFNLLRLINSSGFGLNREITSFRHAVMILGLKKLFRWAALLLTSARSGGVAPAVGNMAIVRGRLMELLATELLPAEDCDNAFVVGVFSLLDTMLGMPLAQALDTLSLPESVNDALRRQTGRLAPFLELAKACENADDEVFAKTATTLRLTNQQVNWAHLQALAWAETLAD